MKLYGAREMGLTQEQHATAKLWHELNGALDLLADKYEDSGNHSGALALRMLCEQSLNGLESFLDTFKMEAAND